VLEWTLENLSAADVARLRAIYAPLTESVRGLIDATIRTEVDAETVAAAKAEIDAATARLRNKQVDGSYGIRFTSDGDRMPWGNVVISSHSGSSDSEDPGSDAENTFVTHSADRTGIG